MPRALLKNYRRPAHDPVRWLCFAVLLATGGCGIVPNEDEGDREPKQAEYRVTITPAAVELSLEKLSETVTLNVECVGQNLPNNCSANRPFWEAPDPTGGNLSVNIANPSETRTTASITLTEKTIKTILGRTSSLVSQVAVPVNIAPTVIPPKARLTGQRFVDVTITIPADTPERHEETPSEPKLSGPLQFSIERLDPNPVTKAIAFIYKGPSTFLVDVVLKGPNAAKFAIARPGLPFALENKTGIVIPVTFLGADSNDFNTYTATVTLLTENGAYVVTKVKAVR